MRILFVYRGYGQNLSNSVIDFQRDSLTKSGIDIETFVITESKVKGYLSAIKKLKVFLRKNKIDIIHAHYSFSGFVSKLASSKEKVICSLMGSDLLQQNIIVKFVTRIFSNFLWDATIVKSDQMKALLPKAFLIPNGVDFSNFRVIPKMEALKFTGYDSLKRNIIFVAQDPDSVVKNYKLAKKSVEFLNDRNVELHIVSNKSFEELPYYYNSADLILLTSLSEGSPNVIKESMACNTPVVSVDVGDIRTIISDTDGCYIASYDPMDIAEKIKLVLNRDKKTNGREKIRHLNSNYIANEIISVYNKFVDPS
ncbi:MAG: glycosyltransferase family 4 protein [Bacteroidetes bacterium]|nr:glycosyltransferase family 4 protein [Bacteroidota bacterium]